MDHTVDSSLKFLSEHCQPVLTSGYGSTNKPSKTAAGVYEVQTLLRYLSAIYDRHILREDEDSQIQMINQKQPQSNSSLSSRQSSGILASDTGRVVSSFAFAFVWAFGGHLHERYNKLRRYSNVTDVCCFCITMAQSSPCFYLPSNGRWIYSQSLCKLFTIFGATSSDANRIVKAGIDLLVHMLL